MKFLTNRNICIARTVRSISLVGGAVGYKKNYLISQLNIKMFLYMNEHMGAQCCIICIHCRLHIVAMNT